MKGALGITRDSDGTLSSLWAWPWYWRYPSGLAIAASAVLLVFYFNGQKPDWMLLAGGGVGLLLALSVMYELGCLVIFAAFVWGLSALVGMFFPDIEVGPKTIGVLACIGAAYVWTVANAAMNLANKHSRMIDEVLRRLGQMEDSRQFATDDLYTRVREIELRLKRLENDDLGVRWTP